MIVAVADTSPLNYLIQINQEELLLRLYNRVHIPGTVLRELGNAVAPHSVRAWAAHPPEWVTVANVKAGQAQFFGSLDPGEAEAILLAQTLHADLLIVDERKASRIRRSLGIETVGTLGVLARAHKRGWVDGRRSFEQLVRTTSFRHTRALRDAFLTVLERW